MSLSALFDDYVIEVPEKKSKSMPTKDEKNNFSLQIEGVVTRHGLTYIEAITHHCESIGLEVEIAATLLNEVVKAKIEVEARNLRYLPKRSSLPI